ncbi:MAG: phenylalanine--tRNA ligase subunit beta [Planctomycetaceae bacterium]|jgi:phenylalanyl-tRNA synthetase beta chain|nr:phenylalanine--tRNA ligase subunit beta [Planctomycetaceae bacterium]
MYISLDWISEYVDLTGLDVKSIANRITLSTAEVEGTKEIRRFVKNVLIGEIKSVEKLTDKLTDKLTGKLTDKLTDKLTFCTVDCGTKTYTTVCGAPNVRIGLKVAFAPAGTTLANNVTITESERSGKVSQGILCSAAELGMSAWHEIVLECPANIKNGTPLEQYIPETDTLIEIDNKSLTHRPDLWGHYGFAREFSAIFGRELKPLPQTDLTMFDNLPPYPLKNEDTENCPCYGCIEFQTCGTVPSPLFIQRRLHALGLRSYNLLVDVTNYVNWEIAQPTHAFDAEKLGGIVVKAAGKETDFETLDGKVRRILPEDLFIWGGKSSGGSSYRPVALAGIMGGLETEVTETTTKLLLESANFKAARIRRTSGRLDLRTDASQRYEKSQPPSSVKTGVARILKLIEDSGAALKVLSRFTLDGDLQDAVRYIEIPAERLEELAGIKLPQERITEILSSLGFSAEWQQTSAAGSRTLVTGVPPHRSRKDISIPEDIVEEVLRVFGYDNIPPVMPPVLLKPLFGEKSLKTETKIRRVLTAAHNFLETHNYIWFNDNGLKEIGYEPDETLVLKNPTSPETSRLRTALMPNLLALIPKNRPYYQEFRLFECGRTFLPTGKNRECNERHAFAGIAFQSAGALDELVLSVKSALSAALATAGLGAVRYVDTAQASTFPWQSPGDWMNVVSADGKDYGCFGILSKEMLKRICPEGGHVVWFEMDTEKILLNDRNNTGEEKFADPPRYPLSWMDFSLIWLEDDGFDKLESVLDGFTHPLVIRREFVVLYKGKTLEKGTASYSFRYLIGSADRTLSGEEIESFRMDFLTFIKNKGVALRA